MNWEDELKLKEGIRNGAIIKKRLFDILNPKEEKKDDGNIQNFQEFIKVCDLLTEYTNNVNTVYPSVKISLKNAKLQLDNMNNLPEEDKKKILDEFNKKTGKTVKDFYDTFSGISVENRIQTAKAISVSIEDTMSVAAMKNEINDLRRIIENLNFEISRLNKQINQISNERDDLFLKLNPQPTETIATPQKTTKKKPTTIGNESTKGIDEERDDDEIKEELKDEIKQEDDIKEEIKQEDEIKEEVKDEIKEETMENEWLKTSMSFEFKNIYHNPDIPTCFSISKQKDMPEINLSGIIRSIETNTNYSKVLKDEYFIAGCNSLSK